MSEQLTDAEVNELETLANRNDAMGTIATAWLKLEGEG